MESSRQREFDQLVHSGYLPELTGMVRKHCAPFCWSAPGNDGFHRMLNNGTVTFLHTGTQVIAVTADHVYEGYLSAKENNAELACQFGGSSFEPEKYLIDRSSELDLATFHFPEILLPHADVFPHNALSWPPKPALERDVVLFGGYPGNLRELKQARLDQPFQHHCAAVKSVSPEQIVLFLDFANMYWTSSDAFEINQRVGGMSGGPVFRIVERAPIDRLEIVGFVKHGSREFELVFAAHASHISDAGFLNQ